MKRLEEVVEKDFYEPLNLSQISSNTANNQGRRRYAKECAACKEKFYQSQEVWMPGCKHAIHKQCVVNAAQKLFTTKRMAIMTGKNNDTPFRIDCAIC